MDRPAERAGPEHRVDDAATCPSCGEPNPPVARFCQQCAAALVDMTEVVGPNRYEPGPWGSDRYDHEELPPDKHAGEERATDGYVREEYAREEYEEVVEYEESVESREQPLSARHSGSESIEWRARVVSTTKRLRAAWDVDALEQARLTADRAIQVFESVGDARGLFDAWSLRALVSWRRGHTSGTSTALGHAAEQARLAADRRGEVAVLRELVSVTLSEPLVVPEAVFRCGEILERLRGERPGEQDAQSALAVLLAREGRREDARDLAARAVTALQGEDLAEELAVAHLRAGIVELIQQDEEVAERSIRLALELAQAAGKDAVQARAAAELAHLLSGSARGTEATQLCSIAQSLAALGDFVTQVRWRSAHGRALAGLGQLEAGEEAARVAVRLGEQTDSSVLRAEALLDLAEVLRIAGRANEAVPIAEKALRTLDRQQALAQAAAARAFTESLGGATRDHGPARRRDLFEVSPPEDALVEDDAVIEDEVEVENPSADEMVDDQAVAEVDAITGGEAPGGDAGEEDPSGELGPGRAEPAEERPAGRRSGSGWIGRRARARSGRARLDDSGPERGSDRRGSSDPSSMWG